MPNLDEFTDIDWGANLDAQLYLDAIPPSMTIRGMFFNGLLSVLKENNIEPDAETHFTDFRDYPARRFGELILEVSQKTRQDIPIRQRMRMLGWRVYTDLSRSMIGKVIFGSGSDIFQTIKMSTNAYEASTNGASIVLESIEENYTITSIEFPVFIDCYQVGVVEGVSIAYGLTPHSKIAEASLSKIRLLTSW